MTPDDSTIKFLEEKVKRSGQNLSNSASKTLTKNGYQVERETPYVDKDEDKGRYTDLKAFTNVPNIEKRSEEMLYVGRLTLIIECKSLPDHV